MRRSSVIAPVSSCGTLKSTRTRDALAGHIYVFHGLFVETHSRYLLPLKFGKALSVYPLKNNSERLDN